ncbi:hypothetical protein C8R46DRAFT_1027631 [Mycena filopes]|nr:hypothetical protein C8R46DRAFT_1027631 [Mycena filopes]
MAVVQFKHFLFVLQGSWDSGDVSMRCGVSSCAEIRHKYSGNVRTEQNARLGEEIFNGLGSGSKHWEPRRVAKFEVAYCSHPSCHTAEVVAAKLRHSTSCNSISPIGLQAQEKVANRPRKVAVYRPYLWLGEFDEPADVDDNRSIRGLQRDWKIFTGGYHSRPVLMAVVSTWCISRLLENSKYCTITVNSSGGVTRDQKIKFVSSSTPTEIMAGVASGCCGPCSEADFYENRHQ